MGEWLAVPGENDSVALALVNSLHRGPGGEVDHVESVGEIESWLGDRGLPVADGVVVAHDVVRLSELRSAARELFTAVADARTPDPGAITMLNIRAAAVPGSVQLSWDAASGAPSQEWHSVAPMTFDAACAAIAADAIAVVTSDRGPLLRRCEAHGCVRVFIREHARRRWCSKGCGDRVRAMRHYHRPQETD